MNRAGSSKSPSGDSAVRERALELAKRLNLLLDAHLADTGKPLPFKSIQADLAKRGHNLSQGRWFYMLDGNGPLTTDVGLLAAISEYFHVPSEFLQSWGDTELPTRIEAQLEHVRSIRRERLTTFATRTLGPLTPEGINLIEQLLASHMSKQAPEEG